MAMPDSSPLSAGLAAEQCEGLSEYELQRMLRISRELCAHSFALALCLARLLFTCAASSQKTA